MSNSFSGNKTHSYLIFQDSVWHFKVPLLRLLFYTVCSQLFHSLSWHRLMPDKSFHGIQLRKVAAKTQTKDECVYLQLACGSAHTSMVVGEVVQEKGEVQGP